MLAQALEGPDGPDMTSVACSKLDVLCCAASCGLLGLTVLLDDVMPTLKTTTHVITLSQDAYLTLTKKHPAAMYRSLSNLHIIASVGCNACDYPSPGPLLNAPNNVLQSCS